MFPGDSITDGTRGRTADPNHILGHGYQFIVAARFGAAFAQRKLTFINRGISGNTVTDLSARWQTDTIDLKPDVLSILIGVNGLSRGVTAEKYEEEYDSLLADTAKRAAFDFPLVNLEAAGRIGASKLGRRTGSAGRKPGGKAEALAPQDL